MSAGLGNARLAFERGGNIRYGADTNQCDRLRRVHDRLDDALDAIGEDFTGIRFEIVILDP